MDTRTTTTTGTTPGTTTRPASPDIDLHPADERGRTDLGWLRSAHAFSFGGFRDPQRMGFGVLRVLNDDWIDPGTGFGEHPHRDMEIITWVLEGALAHRDSLGHGGVLRPGDVQVMSAGRGIVHSEMNGSETEPAHFLQIWIEPSRAGLEPRYDQRSFPIEGRRDRWQTVASGRGAGGALPIGQDAELLIAEVGPGVDLSHATVASRRAYLHVATGEVEVAGHHLGAGDAISIDRPLKLVIRGGSVGGQVLLFDLPAA